MKRFVALKPQVAAERLRGEDGDSQSEMGPQSLSSPDGHSLRRVGLKHQRQEGLEGFRVGDLPLLHGPQDPSQAVGGAPDVLPQVHGLQRLGGERAAVYSPSGKEEA